MKGLSTLSFWHPPSFHEEMEYIELNIVLHVNVNVKVVGDGDNLECQNTELKYHLKE